MFFVLQLLGLMFSFLNLAVVIGGFALIMHYGWGLEVQSWVWIILGPIVTAALSAIFKSLSTVMTR